MIQVFLLRESENLSKRVETPTWVNDSHPQLLHEMIGVQTSLITTKIIHNSDENTEKRVRKKWKKIPTGSKALASTANIARNSVFSPDCENVVEKDSNSSIYFDCRLGIPDWNMEHGYVRPLGTCQDDVARNAFARRKPIGTMPFK